MPHQCGKLYAPPSRDCRVFMNHVRRGLRVCCRTVYPCTSTVENVEQVNATDNLCRSLHMTEHFSQPPPSHQLHVQSQLACTASSKSERASRYWICCVWISHAQCKALGLTVEGTASGTVQQRTEGSRMSDVSIALCK